MKRRLKLIALSVTLAVAGLLAVVPMAEAGYPPFVGNKYCRYHLPWSDPKSCVSREVYWWVF